MNKAILLPIILFSFLDLSGQDLVAAIPLNSQIKKVQGEVSGDSLFLSFHDGGNDSGSFRAMFIMPDGTQKNVDIKELMERPFLGTITTTDSIYFYYLEELRKSIELRAVVFDKTLTHKTNPGWHLALPENILATFKDKNLSIAYAKNDWTVELIQINQLAVVNKMEYRLPLPLFERKKQSRTFINEGDEVSPSEAEASRKFYLKDKELVVGIDDKDIYNEKPQGKTTIIRVDSTSYASNVMSERSGKPFSTFIHNDFIYKVVKSSGLQVFIYDMNQKLVRSFIINKQSPFNKEPAYFRDTKTERVFNNSTVWRAANGQGDPFISVHSLDSGKVILKLGTHEKFEGAPFPSMAGLSLALMVISTTVKMATMAANNSESMDVFFYMTGNPQTGFTHTNATNLISQTIDNFELVDDENPTYYRYKGYLHGKSRTFCIYQLTKGQSEVKIMRFKQ